MHFLTDDSYGANKRRCEEVFLNAAQNGGFSHWTIFRPCHIYGPNSKLGCLPNHGRDPELIDRILRGEPLELAAAGTLLQQPIYAEDLAKVILSCVDVPKSCCQFYNCAGPEIAESATYYKIIADYGRVIIGQKQVAEELLIAIAAGGHCLMIGLPGLAKTLMVSTLAQILQLQFKRVQFTPDLMPSDIIGTDVLDIDEQTGRKSFRFIKGPIFTNMLH